VIDCYRQLQATQGKKVSTLRINKRWNVFLRDAESPSLEVLKIQTHKALEKESEFTHSERHRIKTVLEKINYFI